MSGAARIDATFFALADPTRREVVSLLATTPTVTASELTRRFPLTRQAIAKHLAALAAAGLVTATRAGRETRYRLTPEPLDAAAAWLADVGGAWDERLDALARLAATGSASATHRDA
jgi:DNA-binding transcriptional ArsR family regulator